MNKVKKQLMGRKFIIVIVLSLSLAACGASGTSANSTGSLSGGWLHSYSSAVEFFQLTVNGSQVSGQEQEEYATNETPPHLLQSSSTVSGIFNGTQVTLTFSIYGFPVRTYAGTYGSNALTLAVPDQSGNLQSIAYQPASTDDYNNAVQQLQQSVSQQVQAYENAVATATEAAYQQQVAAATATAIADEQQKLASNIANIGGVISSLNSDANFGSLLQGYSNDIHSMQTDYQTEQNDAAGGCANYYQVGVDNYHVGVDDYHIGSDDYNLQTQVSSVQSNISNLQDWVNTIQHQWNDLGQQAFSGVNTSNVSKAIQNGNNAINQAKANMQSAQSQASSFDTQAKQTDQQAQALYDGMHC